MARSFRPARRQLRLHGITIYGNTAGAHNAAKVLGTDRFRAGFMRVPCCTPSLFRIDMIDRLRGIGRRETYHDIKLRTGSFSTDMQSRRSGRVRCM